MYKVIKTYGNERGLSCAFRQWRAESHCSYLHGYAIGVELTFASHALDANNWVIDFGSLKPIKDMLEHWFDHTVFLAEDDPYLEAFRELDKTDVLDLRVATRVGCEAFAEMIYKYVYTWLAATALKNQPQILSVRVFEHSANAAVYEVPYV